LKFSPLRAKNRQLGVIFRVSVQIPLLCRKRWC